MAPANPIDSLIPLSGSECVRLLRTNSLGRIAVVDRLGWPEVFPVNYFFDDGIVVFRTDPGAKLELAPGSHAAFEIDGWDETTATAWSVVVKGIGHEIPDTDPRARRIHAWPVRPLAGGPKEHFVGIWANEITGRRVKPSAIS